MGEAIGEFIWAFSSIALAPRWDAMEASVWNSGEVEVLWMEGIEGLEAYGSDSPLGRPRRQKAIAGDFGLFTGRKDHWQFEVICRKGSSGHSHSDLLSVTAAYKGVDVLMDPGTFLYMDDLEVRNQYRGVAYHNAACVNGQDYNRFKVSGRRGKRRRLGT